MSSSSSTPQDRYRQVIDHLLTAYLQGKFPSIPLLEQALAAELEQLKLEIEIDPEYFQCCLLDQEQSLQSQLSTSDTATQAKAERSLRGLKVIKKTWQQLAQETQAKSTITVAVNNLAQAQDTHQAFLLLVQEVDQNRNPALSPSDIKQLSVALQQKGQASSTQVQRLEQLATGLTKGLTTCSKLQVHVLGWIFDDPKKAGINLGNNPWEYWARKIAPVEQTAQSIGFGLISTQPTVKPSLPQTVFQVLSKPNHSVQQWASQPSTYRVQDWVELLMIMQFLQRGLVSWFDQQAFDPKVGPKQSISTYLTFASIWLAIATGIQERDPQNVLGEACFQITLQILRSFAKQPYFPLYGGIFASFYGGYLRSTLDYLDVPLQKVEGTQEKARILTLLGYSQRAIGQYDQAISFHQEALEIARTAEDRACEIANLNHLSRTHIAQKDYAQSVNFAQRALMMSRERGERLGQANALANLGFSQVFAAQQLERAESDHYAIAMSYLQQGLDLAEKQQDFLSQALCHSSLGSAYLVLSQPQEAIHHLEAGLQAARTSGDLYLQGLNCLNLAEALYAINQGNSTVYYGCLGLYLLNTIQSPDWTQAAGLLTVVRGKIGSETFQTILQQEKSRIEQAIGGDGYTQIPTLLEQYGQH
ncbi:tetratricopeptide repeat protein [Acaryochloris sp. IP29b_bin.137]|uniref:tetratricopeptide repeat protein n=1 Tax=Acaryochloris sp. IP29b_bin.137 TaxID=2969217 RepID=UPI0026131D1F|nr:tetratricopeptide repeat protein [Acaryochloris sp. IP29b_bin.137]